MHVVELLHSSLLVQMSLKTMVWSIDVMRLMMRDRALMLSDFLFISCYI